MSTNHVKSKGLTGLKGRTDSKRHQSGMFDRVIVFPPRLKCPRQWFAAGQPLKARSLKTLNSIVNGVKRIGRVGQKGCGLFGQGDMGGLGEFGNHHGEEPVASAGLSDGAG